MRSTNLPVLILQDFLPRKEALWPLLSLKNVQPNKEEVALYKYFISNDVVWWVGWVGPGPLSPPQKGKDPILFQFSCDHLEAANPGHWL